MADRFHVPPDLAARPDLLERFLRSHAEAARAAYDATVADETSGANVRRTRRRRFLETLETHGEAWGVDLRSFTRIGPSEKVG